MRFSLRVQVATGLFLVSSSLVNCSPSSLTEATSAQPSSSSVAPSGTTTSGGPIPSQSADPTTTGDLQTVLGRRLSYITRGITKVSMIPAWTSSIGENGAWLDVDYTSGCTAQRANWPIQQHWIRLSTMAAAWHGGISASENSNAGVYVKNATTLDAISRGMDYWFNNLYNLTDCIDLGGLPQCPCDTPGFWNTNWFSNLILVPKLVGETCVLINSDNSTLSSTQLSGCNTVLSRTYVQINNYINGIGYLTGANTLDTASIGIDLGLLNNNATIVQASYNRIHKELAVQEALFADGIRPDGSFGQHEGVLYNGNYGKDYANDVFALEIYAGGTQYAAANTSRDAFANLLDADRWMIFQNKLTGILHWDFSVLGRFISFAVSDEQATGNININATDVQVLGELWNSPTIKDFAVDLGKNSSSANLGDIHGNRMFYSNDYMVQRGPGYMTSVKMFSSRTTNTECLNSQNPFGFHLSDGVVHTYLNGNEYEDIAASWDWNLIPGTTVDYGADLLDCNHTSWNGTEAFVGGVSEGTIGAAVMRYTNPMSHSLRWQKAWFFLENDVQIVVLSDLASNTSNATNIVSVLDQRLRNGSYYVDGVQQTSTKVSQNVSSYDFASSLWHGGVGYTFDLWSPLSLKVETGDKTGNWSELGISAHPISTVDLFVAWVDQPISNTFAYSVFPGTTQKEFEKKAFKLVFEHKVIRNDKHVSAVLDQTTDTAMIVFWDSDGGSVSIPGTLLGRSGVTLSVDANAVVIYKIGVGNVTVSDPSQNKTSLKMQLKAQGFGEKPKGFGNSAVKQLSFQLPVNGSAGSSISQTL